jgi:hypothetical protein
MIRGKPIFEKIAAAEKPKRKMIARDKSIVFPPK